MASGSLRAGGKSPKTGAQRALRLRHGRRRRLSRPGKFLVADLRPRHRLVDRPSASPSKKPRREESGSIKRAKSPSARSTKKMSARALSRVSNRDLLNLGGSYLNGIEGVSLIVENNRVVGLIGKRDGESIELPRPRDDSFHRRFRRQPRARQEIHRLPRRSLQTARLQAGHRRRPAHGAGRRRQGGQSEIFLRPSDRAQSAHRRPLLALSALGLIRR